ncbi:MAG: hypothetical protein CO094_11490 [Anaerolineae bacterium CG_4_9_14_3_um_filter_57_17]|nr:protein kinase [bacterium]NCT21480.1 protein kinase [bacterium]PJB64923.1 MAG: hypothetical protein CO094_11490 [Anaerolineae bacterium CG_4_9_14_3_um_filter_57_17]
MTFTTGASVGPYRILEQLGQGGMATVYKAYHASLDRYVAIKVLHQAFLEDPSFLARFQREARLVARLEHPNIVPIYDYAEHEGQPYLVMKYIDGETLKARLQRGRLTPDELERIIDQVGAGLAYAHKQGILHRDIKPSNVILASDGNIYLADFGLARIAQAGESTLTSDMVLGTPQYISPEQALGKKDLDEGTDIYSFGVMLYEMTTGRVPFSADTPFSVIHDHIYTPLPLPTSINPNLSADVERVLLKSLSKEREDRYADVPAFVEDFKQAWSGSAATQSALPPVSAPEATTLLPVSPAASAALTSSAVSPAISAPESAPAAAKKSLRWWWFVLPIALCLCCLLVFAVSRNKKPSGQSSETAQPPVAQATLALPDADVISTQVAATVEAALPLPPPTNPQNRQTPPDQPQPIVSIEIVPMSLADAQALAQSHPEDPKTHLFFGHALLQDGQEKQAYAEFARAAELAKDQPALLIAIGLALEKNDNWLGALLMYVQVSKNERIIRIADAVDHLHEAAYRGFEQKIAPDVISFKTLNDFDAVAGLLAETHYALLYGDVSKAQALTDKLRSVASTPAYADLLQAEIAIVQGKLSDAHKFLGGLSEPTVPQWIQRRAQELLQKIG